MTRADAGESKRVKTSIPAPLRNSKGGNSAFSIFPE